LLSIEYNGQNDTKARAIAINVHSLKSTVSTRRLLMTGVSQQ